MELNIPKDGNTIYGELYLPDESSDLPLVILSHGFGDTHRDMEDYAEAFAENGIAAFVFDFEGGGMGSRSDGSMTEMSVLTEAADLDAVIDYFQDYDGIDTSHIFLLGASQGGFVSTYVAGERPQDIAGLVVLYPAYVLQDDSRERNPDPENGPDTSSIMGMTVGKIYDIDAQSFDIYDSMAAYSGKVLIIHGTADSIAPISYSERAVDTFPNAELFTIEGVGHGFYGDAEQTAAEQAFMFMEEILQNDNPDTSEETDKSAALQMTIGGTPVSVSWEDNESVDALKELVSDEPLTIQMSMYGGFEQVGSLGTSLPRDDVQTMTSAGDIVLYSGNQIVVFYGSNSWAYTRLGKITDKTADEMTQLLGNGDVEITLSVQNE
ncbi:MAG: cyclophilin-like fold protein [Chordicoccus sp.]